MTLPRLTASTARRLGLVAATAAQDEEGVSVLQFGTGAFLRGFADVFVDEARQAGRLAGRVVAVGSTGSGRTRALNEQNGLYTLWQRGQQGGLTVDEAAVVASVSHAVASADDWGAVLEVARAPELALVISNTTEVGLAYDPDDRIDLDPPRSFPGKLTAVLYERVRSFDHDPGKGLIVLPCELLPANGDLLKSYVRALAERWGLGQPFLSWLDAANTFCNTLVDRIVPGTPDDAGEAFERLGYRDDLLTVAEPYRLWAIEGGTDLRTRLPLAGPTLVIDRDITPYRERKVRILNGGHTSTVPTALLCGLETVREAVTDPRTGAFVRRVLFEEIVPSLDIDAGMARAFASDVLERFANPYIRHELIGITFQQTMKMRVRVIPSIVRYVEKLGEVPPSLTFGVAMFLLYTHREVGPSLDARPKDDAAQDWHRRWAGVDRTDAKAVRAWIGDVAADEAIWGTRLDVLPGCVEAVSGHLVRAARDGVPAALDAHLRAVDAAPLRVSASDD